MHSALPLLCRLWLQEPQGALGLMWPICAVAFNLAFNALQDMAQGAPKSAGFQPGWSWLNASGPCC